MAVQPGPAYVMAPPLDLHRRRLPIIRLAGPWVRIHRVEHDPLFFGTTGRNRFDDPLGRFGVLYVAEGPAGAFIEVFGFGVVGGINTVRESEVLALAFASIEVARPMRLVDLTGPGLARIGATNELTAGPHSAAQQWSRVLWGHPSRPDGLLYRARHDPSCLSIALFQRVRRHVATRPLGGLLSPENRMLLGQLLDRYAFSLRMDVTYGE
jgi:hypothetical protein